MSPVRAVHNNVYINVLPPRTHEFSMEAAKDSLCRFFSLRSPALRLAGCSHSHHRAGRHLSRLCICSPVSLWLHLRLISTLSRHISLRLHLCPVNGSALKRFPVAALSSGHSVWFCSHLHFPAAAFHIHPVPSCYCSYCFGGQYSAFVQQPARYCLYLHNKKSCSNGISPPYGSISSGFSGILA